MCTLFPFEQGVERNEFFLESPFDSLPISVLEMKPQIQPSAVVYLVHGLCGCKERFIPFMEYLTENGIACVASDHRGHGDSILKEEDRGYMYQGGVESILADMEAVSFYIKEYYKDVPFILLGHSMGSLATRAYTKKNDSQLDGLILCGSPSPNSLAPIGRLIVKEMCRKDNGKRRPESLQKFTSSRYNRKFRQEGYQAWTCSDPEVRRRFADDPRCNFNITADCAYTLMKLFEEAYSKRGWIVSNPELPVIFLSGEDDPCMISRRKFQKSVRRMIKNGYTSTEDILYPGMRHEILNEVDKVSVWEDILNYIRRLLQESFADPFQTVPAVHEDETTDVFVEGENHPHSYESPAESYTK